VTGVDQAPPRTLLEYLVRTSHRTIEENCAAFEQTAQDHDEKATLSPRQLWRWMAGEVAGARPVAQRVAERHWGYRFEALIGPPLPPAQLALTRSAAEQETASDGDAAAPFGLSVIEQVERLRQGIHDVISTASLTEASLDEWDETLIRHGQATRYRPAPALLVELSADFAELQRVLARRQTSSALRRLTRTTAQMAGLMFLTLIKLNAPIAARNWARTARVAADEAADPAIRSWVRAQEAYVHYYSGHLAEALDVARHAQVLVGRTACVGLPLAAALEARALAALGHGREARDALVRAEAAVGALDGDALTPSAFGYNEAQLRFHEGNTLTHLRDTKGAKAAQDRALDLYPATDYLDRTLLQLDRASCLAYDGDAITAMTHATHSLLALTDEQRSGMILLRGRQVVDSLTEPQRALPAARDFRDLLLTAEEEGIHL
jgi:tetratricopeptide (TPR) repeat protein